MNRNLPDAQGNDRVVPPQERRAQRRSYSTPTLRLLGSLRSLTTGGSGIVQESGVNVGILFFP